MGHGHVTPNEDGTRARCGGPGICAQCSRELAEKVKSKRPRRTANLPMPGVHPPDRGRKTRNRIPE